MQNYSRKSEKSENNLLFFEQGKSIKSIDDGLHALRQALGEKNKKASVLKILEHLQRILNLKLHRDVFFTKDGIQFCVVQIAPLLIDENDKISHSSLSIMEAFVPSFRRSIVTSNMQITAIGISKTLVEGLIKMRDMGNSRWHRIWCTWIKILLTVFVQPNELSLVNSVLKVVEGGFKHTNIDIRTQSFECWKTLLKILAGEGQLVGKLISLMAIPLYYTTNYNNALAEVKFSTWWYFLCNIKGNINQENTPMVVTPFLKFCFEPYTTVFGGRIITESISLSPGKKVTTLHEKVICALVYLLGSADEAVVNLKEKSGVEVATESILNLDIYREIQGDIVWSCQEATLMLVELKDVDSLGICRNLWSNLQKFFGSDPTLKSLKDLFDVMEVLGVRCEDVPKIIPHLHIIVDKMLRVEQDNRYFPSDLITFLDIMQQAINFLLNTSPDIIKSEQINKISTFIFEIFPRSNNMEMQEKLLDIFVAIDVKSTKNLSSLHTLTKNYMGFLVRYRRNLAKVYPEKRSEIIEMMGDKLFKWCLDGYQLNSQYTKEDFMRDWKPICEEFVVLGVKSIRELYNRKSQEAGKEFMDIFEKLVKVDRNNLTSSHGLTEQTDNDSFVEITPKNVPMLRIRTNILTETQKEKLQKRSDDIPALYNDMSQSVESMPFTDTSTESQLVSKENVSSSVVEATPNETSITNLKMMKELERLKTDTVEGHNLVIVPRSARRKSNVTEAKNDEQPKRIQTRRSSLLLTQNVQKEVTPVSKKKKKDDVLRESPVPALRLRDMKTPSPEKVKKPSVDHNYHIRLQKTPSPGKVTRNSPMKNGLSDDLMVVMLRNAREEFEALKKRCEAEVNENNEALLAQAKASTKEQSKVSPTKNATKVIPIQKIKPFSLDSSETQSLFSESQEELPLGQPMNLSQADTQVQTPEENQTLTREEPTSLFVECDSVGQNNDDTLKNTENTSPNPLTKIFVRINENNKNSPKTGHSTRSFYKVKENPRADLSNSGGAQGSPKFTSRAAQMLSMITSSPSTSSKQTDVATASKTPSKEDDAILRFSTTCPPPNATPRLSILKRKRDANLDESTDMTTKKRRISFHDPPVTRTKEYILDESEIAIKQTDNLRRKNLLMDSPPTAEPEEMDDNDSDWEDLGDDVAIVEPLVVAGPKKASKKGKKGTRRNPSREKDKRPPPPVMVSIGADQIMENPTEEVPEMKIIFTNDDEVFNYALMKFKDKLFDHILTNSQDMQNFVGKVVERFGSLTLNEILSILGISKST